MQDALASAEYGDKIWVAEGIYKATDSTDPFEIIKSFNLKNSVGIKGGFLGNETSPNPKGFAYDTILTGKVDFSLD